MQIVEPLVLPPNFTNLFVVRYTIAVISACTAELVTYPFDLTKTRLQIQNEIATAKHGFKMEHYGMYRTFVQIVKNEGVFKLWCGLTAMCQRHIVYAGTRVVLYERLRNFFVDHGIQSIATATFCGFTAGGLAQFIASPTDLVKVNMQSEGRRILQGKPPQFTGTISVYKMLYKNSGILGFWRGAIPNAQRAALVNVGNLTAYDYSKQFLLRNFNMADNFILHTMSASVAGLFATILSTPVDVVKTRLMNQSTGTDGKGALYKGVIDCIQQTFKNEGPSAFYKGFVPVWLRLGPWALVNWITFENLLLLLGGSTF